MVVLMQSGASEDQVQHVIDRLVSLGFDIPERALSDGAQSLYFDQFENLMSELRMIAPAVGRRLA